MHQKVLLIIIDGLRPDAVTPAQMPNLSDLTRRGWRPEEARTVRPSITVAALTSIATGVSPDRHGLVSTGVDALRRLRGLRPLPAELRRHGIETTVITPPLGGGARWLAGALLRYGGVTRLSMPGPSPKAILAAAAARVAEPSAREMVVAYVNETDLAGHASGWMSAPYLRAARVVDDALGALEPLVEDPNVLVILCADHGGGGVLSHDHDDHHPLNERIPLLLVGGRIAAGMMSGLTAGLLDIAPTVLRAFGIPAPEQYSGSALTAGFLRDPLDSLLRDPFAELVPSAR